MENINTYTATTTIIITTTKRKKNRQHKNTANSQTVSKNQRTKKSVGIAVLVLVFSVVSVIV